MLCWLRACRIGLATRSTRFAGSSYGLVQTGQSGAGAWWPRTPAAGRRSSGAWASATCGCPATHCKPDGFGFRRPTRTGLGANYRSKHALRFRHSLEHRRSSSSATESGLCSGKIGGYRGSRSRTLHLVSTASSWFALGAASLSETASKIGDGPTACREVCPCRLSWISSTCGG
jgi:hypothetical protein